MPITNFPAYTGTALSRNLTQVQFDEAEEYFQAYHAAWAAQMNGTTIPQLNALETTCTNSASTATTKAGEALSSANSAGDSATLAGKWASEAVGVVVQSGKYSAFHWATKAYEYVATLAAGAINDSITALNATWSSTKLSTLTKDQISAATAKTTPADADSIGILDSAASNSLKKLTFANLWAWVVSQIGVVGINTSKNVLVTGAGGLGYGTGSGGTVTQATSKTTTVTLNKPTGQITMNNAALAAGATVKFTLTNSSISSSTDLIIINVVSGIAGFENYNVWGSCWSGAATITLKNISAGSLSEALVLNFAVIKGATA